MATSINEAVEEYLGVQLDVADPLDFEITVEEPIDLTEKREPEVPLEEFILAGL